MWIRSIAYRGRRPEYSLPPSRCRRRSRWRRNPPGAKRKKREEESACTPIWINASRWGIFSLKYFCAQSNCNRRSNRGGGLDALHRAPEQFGGPAGDFHALGAIPVCAGLLHRTGAGPRRVWRWPPGPSTDGSPSVRPGRGRLLGFSWCRRCRWCCLRSSGTSAHHLVQRERDLVRMPGAPRYDVLQMMRSSFTESKERTP